MAGGSTSLLIAVSVACAFALITVANAQLRLEFCGSTEILSLKCIENPGGFQINAQNRTVCFCVMLQGAIPTYNCIRADGKIKTEDLERLIETIRNATSALNSIIPAGTFSLPGIGGAGGQNNSAGGTPNPLAGGDLGGLPNPLPGGGLSGLTNIFGNRATASSSSSQEQVEDDESEDGEDDEASDIDSSIATNSLGIPEPGEITRLFEAADSSSDSPETRTLKPARSKGKSKERSRARFPSLGRNPINPFGR
ncbi:unnamed protein product [Orchesella dallaii]|uniref:Uncharacterized protein n=1 Tax=Orchesella dallaii TaxID=48710 RepID=A0ABP1RV21_9HEXA